MATPTTHQLLSVLAGNAPAPGYVLVPADKLVIPRDNHTQRIDYTGYFNPDTNHLVLTGTPRPKSLNNDSLPQRHSRDAWPVSAATNDPIYRKAA